MAINKPSDKRRLITVAIFTLPTELLVIRSRLEAEGIKCFAKDELFIQAINFYSQAVGGVKLQVLDNQVEIAHQILLEFGYKPYVEKGLPGYIGWLDENTQLFPILSKFRIEARLMILLSILVATPLLIWFYTSKGFVNNTSGPTDYLIEILTEDTWCVRHVIYNGEACPLEADELSIVPSSNCPTSMSFGKDGLAMLPGLNSNQVFAKWNIVNDSLVVSSSDTFDYLFNHRYRIGIQNDNLTLWSASTIIHCNKITFGWR